MKKQNILFYSSVCDKLLFKRMSFYNTDISALQELGYNVILSNNFLDFLKFYNYDIAYIYFYRKGVLCAFIARIFGKKIFFSGGIDYLDSNFNNNFYKRYLQKCLFYLAYQLSTGCNIVSRSDSDNVERIIPNNKKIFFFPHSINLNEFISSELIKKKVITTICWMESVENVKRKGLEDVLDVFHEIWKIDPDYKLIIIGTKGIGTDYLFKIIEKRSIPSINIIFTGGISDNEKIVILKSSKFYFQFSKYEGFGVAALEALASRNIVVHSGKGGLKDTLLDFGYDVGWPINKVKVLSVFQKYQPLEGYDLLNYNDYVVKYLNLSYSYSSRLFNLSTMVNKGDMN